LVISVVLVGGCADQGSLRAPDAGLTYGFTYDDTPKSTGFHLCIPGGPVDLLSVTPIALEGDVEFLGAVVLPAPGESVGTAEGFPPVAYEATPFEDFTVTAGCDIEHLVESSQVAVGTDWGAPEGGAIHGLRVEYTYRGERGSLELPDFNVAMCGVGGEFCED
jgi:hypothetical protein